MVDDLASLFQVCLEKYSVAVCDDLYAPVNEAALNYTQTGASHWVLASTLSLTLPSILTAQLLGSWSDTYGRKIPMLLPPVGELLADVRHTYELLNLMS